MKSFLCSKKTMFEKNMAKFYFGYVWKKNIAKFYFDYVWKKFGYVS